MSIKDISKQEQPHEKMINLGPSTLSNAELLAILFRRGNENKPAIELAQGLLHRFGSLRNIISQAPNSICQTAGIDISKYCIIQASHELMTRLLIEIGRASCRERV